MGKWLTALARGASGLLWLLALAVLLFYLYVYWTYAEALLHFPFDYDQGESYDVYSGILLGQGRWIYNDNSLYPFYSSNYPPLYSVLVSLAVRFLGPSLFAGRLISVVASCMIGLLIYAIVSRRTRSRVIGVTAALAFFASTYVYHVTPLARVNPSMALFALMGVYCTGKLRWRWLALGVLFLLFALYTKQTAVDAVAASLLYLLLCRWRRALVVGIILAVLGGGTFYLLDQQSAGQFYLNVVAANINPFDWGQAERYYLNFLEIHGLLLGLSTLGIALALWKRRLTIYHLYALTSIGMAAGAGKWGAGESYFLNAVVATCIVAGLTLGQLRTNLSIGLRPVLPLLLLLQMPLLWHGPYDGTKWGLVDRGLQQSVLGQPPSARDEAAGWCIVGYVDRSKGDVLLEESSFALADRKPIIGNPSQLLNLSQLGQWDERWLVDALNRQHFGLVVLTAHFYPQSVLEAIGKNYGTVDIIEMGDVPYRVLLPNPVQAQALNASDETVSSAAPEEVPTETEPPQEADLGSEPTDPTSGIPPDDGDVANDLPSR
ncbi:MAG: glycosyltransferase family 39 protein [Chloroflexota bacterium]|nr:MAG: glycosyltransferase family 39 protein [Chloroflexota bacterium]